MKKFSENSTQSNRARQIYGILIGYAMRRQTITYGDLKQLMYPNSDRRIGVMLQHELGHILYWCRDNGLPLLNSIVVNQETGLPGDGCGVAVEDVPAEQRTVYKTDWYAIEPPSTEEIKAYDTEAA